MDAGLLAGVQRRFIPPPGVGASRPRNVRLTAAGRVVAALAVLFAAGAVAAFVALAAESLRETASRRTLELDGVITMGAVTRIGADKGGDRGRVWYVFTVGDQTYHGDTRVSGSRRRMLHVGSSMAVRYLPGNPRLHDPGGTPRSGVPLWVAPLAAAALAGAGALCLVGILRQRSLLMDGRAAPAVVSALRVKRGSEGGKDVAMAYDFPLLSGAALSGVSPAPRKPPAVGTIMCVVYDPERPQRNRIYPFSLVRPAVED